MTAKAVITGHFRPIISDSMKKIKLLVDARNFGGEGQGSLTYLKGLYLALLENYGDVYELYFAGYDEAAVMEVFGAYNVRFLLLKNKSRLKLWLNEFPDLIRENNIEFAHFQYITPIKKTCQYIVTTHDVLFNDFPGEFGWSYRTQRNFLFKRSLLQSDIRLTVSEYSRRKIAQHYRIDADTISITPNAPMESFLQPFDRNKSEQFVQDKFGLDKYILYVSRLEPRKNHLALLDAWQDLELAKQGIHLVFVGNNTLNDSSLTHSFNHLTEKETAHFHWMKNVSDEHLLELYRAANLFVYPSKAEGFGIPPLEAAVLGVNTICSNVTAMQDFNFFKNNHISPDNLDLLKTMISQNLTLAPERVELDNIARIIREKYSWERSAEVLHGEVLRCLDVAYRRIAA